jgi:hypothetical protein
MHLQKMPPIKVVNHHKGKVDIYLRKGVPVARKWPGRHPRPLPAGQRDTMATFAALQEQQKRVNALTHDSAQQLAKGSLWTYRDVLMRAAYGKLIDW